MATLLETNDVCLYFMNKDFQDHVFSVFERVLDFTASFTPIQNPLQMYFLTNDTSWRYLSAEYEE